MEMSENLRLEGIKRKKERMRQANQIFRRIPLPLVKKLCHFLPQRSVEREALVYWLSGNGRGYSHYARNRRAGKKYVTFLPFFVSNAAPYSLCVGVAIFSYGFFPSKGI